MYKQQSIRKKIHNKQKTNLQKNKCFFCVGYLLLGMRPTLKCDLYTQGDATEEDFPLLAVFKWSQFLGWGWGLVFTCAGPKHPATVSGSPTVSLEGLVFLVSSILWGKL